MCVYWRHLENIRSGESNGCFLMRKARFCSLPEEKKKKKAAKLGVYDLASETEAEIKLRVASQTLRTF